MTSRPKNSPGRSSRSEAARLLTRWLERGEFPDRLMASVQQDRAFVMEVVYGCARRRRTLDWIIKRYSRQQTEKRVRAILYVGLYQLLMMDTVAEHAAVNETVKAVRQSGLGRSAGGFINAVLRRVLREKEQLLNDLAQEPLGTRESHPEILIRRWTSGFGEEETAALCRWNNERPRVTVRVHLGRTDVGAYLEALREAGFEGEPHPAAPECCIELAHGARVESLPGYEEGLFVVQDPSTLTAVDALALEPGLCVLDACAAPGGKALLIAERLGDSGKVIAADISETRLRPLRENLERMKSDHVEVVLADIVRDAAPLAERGPYDRILLDVPCTNTGVLRRRADARWRFSEDVLRDAVALQHQILHAAAPMLKPDGQLVYSTCSLEPEEDTELVRAWVRAHPDYVVEREVSRLPMRDGTDGAYVAVLKHAP